MVALKTLIFTILVPGTVAGIVPWLLPLAPLAIVGRGESHPITLADWSAPSAAGSRTLLLVCRGVHLHRQRHASAHRRAGLPGQRRALPMGAQSDVSWCPFGSHRRGHSLPLAFAAWLCTTGMGSGASLCGLL